MTAAPIRSIAVLGGGTAGWVAAAALARSLRDRVQISVITSPDVPIVGVGEATIPPILQFLAMLGIDEAEFIAATGATYKLGIVFADWCGLGHRYWHPFGTFGNPINGRPFYHYVQRARAEGQAAGVAQYSLAAALGDAGRFLRANGGRDPARDGLRHALHFDAALVGRYLCRFATRLGVREISGTVTSVQMAGTQLQTLLLADGRRIAADLFVDCSGFRGRLIDQALGVPWLDYSTWLPCDRAIAVPSAVLNPLPPYTLAAAHTAGWRWRIPLQHRTGNGVVYCSRLMTDAAAQDLLLATIDGAPAAPPRRLQFTAGRRQVFWQGNCVALGLSSGFLEPLESTSIQLVIDGVLRLLDHFPDRGFDAANIAAYNTTMTTHFDHIRDFIVLHYAQARRDDTAFWRYCTGMALPPDLAERVALYRGTGRIVPRPAEMFTDLSWFYVLDGLGVVPNAIDPLALLPASADLDRVFAQLRAGVARQVQAAPAHASLFAPPMLASSP